MYRCRLLPEHHLTRIDGIPTTRVARTLVDLAAVLHPDRVERAVDNGLAMGIVALPALAVTFGELATRGRAGIAVMRGILDERGEGYVAPASELEARFLALVRSAGLPEPARQLDAGAWIGSVGSTSPTRQRGCSSSATAGGTTRRFSTAGRTRNGIAASRRPAGGWRVARFAWADVTSSPAQVVARLEWLLRAHAG